MNGCFYSSEPKNLEVFCCKCHAQGAKCTNCRCKKSGIQCTNCIPMQNGNCSNKATLMQPKFKNDECVDLPT